MKVAHRPDDCPIARYGVCGGVVNVLVVEDNERLAASVAEGLREEGHTVETVARGDDAISRIETRRSDVVVLDLGLPDLDGLEVLHRIRGQGLMLPVLVLTARDAVDDRVRALDMGADDEERALRDESIERGWEQAQAGLGRPAAEVLAELKSRR